MISSHFLNILQKICFILLISILSLSNSQEQKFFTSSNDKIIMVSKEGIFFFTTKMAEEESKRILFDDVVSYDTLDEDKIIFEEFSKEDGGYLMITVTNLIYFFDSDGYIINFVYLSDDLKDLNYTLIPYKKENNFLYYIITYRQKQSLIINQFKFNIDYPNINQMISSKTLSIKPNTNSKKDNNDDILITNITKINCIFKYDSSPNKNNDTLVCFYVAAFPQIEIQAKFLEIKNDFKEIAQNFRTLGIINEKFQFPNFFSTRRDEKGKKAFIYLNNGYPYMINFYLDKLVFGEITKIIDINIFNTGYSSHKMLKIRNDSETLIISSIKYNFCKLYILNLDSDFNIINKAVIDQNFQCENINSFSSLVNGAIYTILNINNSFYLKKLNKKSRNLDSIEEKCSASTEESKIFNLCTECASDYYPTETPTNITYNSSFIECYQKDKQPKSFYFDNAVQKFKPCYETCAECNEAGNEYNNKCTKCAVHYKESPTSPSDCVATCTYFYYYTFYGQYKCSEGTNCPEEAPLYIFKKKKCIDDCQSDTDYKYLYGGECLEGCPDGTKSKEDNEYICIDDVENSASKCKLSKKEMEIQGQSLEETVNVAAKTYSEEFSYTNTHISYYYNNEFSFVLYQDYECIEEKNIDITKIDFGDCYTKVKGTKGLDDNEEIIVALVERKNESGKSISIFYFYDPRDGSKIDTNSICADDTVVVKKSVTEELNNTDLDFGSMMYLTDQNIDIFDLHGEFYTDICFHFESPNGKDVPLNDRILAFYPNISLCDKGCTSKGVNLTTMESICECALSGILNNDLISGNALIESTFGEAAEFIANSNLDVLTCYKDVFDIKYFKKNIGGIIILCILALQIVFAVLFYTISMTEVARYLSNLSEFFSTLIIIRTKEKSEGKNEKTEKNKDKEKTKLKISNLKENPPKKEDKEKIKKKKKEIRETEQVKKRSLKSLNKLDEDGCGTNLNSQKSFDKLYKDKLTSKFGQNILKKMDKKGQDENIKKGEVEIFKLKGDKYNKKDADIEIKKIQEKYGVDEEDYLKTDVDDMEFDDAIKYDNRSFLEYFWDKTKENQIIFNTFINRENLKPMTIKVILLLLNMDLYFVVNGLFYSESYISELFHSEEEEKFFSYFSRSISRFFYTSVVGVIASTIMDCILIEEKKVKRVFMREKENHVQVKHEISLIIKSLKRNYIIFIAICFFISLISWYYVTCFNNVYPGVKIEWIKSSLTIMIIMQILSFLVGVLVAIIRLIAFKCKSEKLYKLKDFFN